MTVTISMDISDDLLSKFKKITNRLCLTPERVIGRFMEEYVDARETILETKQTLIDEFCRANP